MIGEEERHDRPCSHGSISNFVWAKPESTSVSKVFADNFHEDPCVFLIDDFRSSSWDVYGTQWSICIWVLGEFEYALDSSSQSENRAQNGVA